MDQSRGGISASSALIVTPCLQCSSCCTSRLCQKRSLGGRLKTERGLPPCLWVSFSSHNAVTAWLALPLLFFQGSVHSCPSSLDSASAQGPLPQPRGSSCLVPLLLLYFLVSSLGSSFVRNFPVQIAAVFLFRLVDYGIGLRNGTRRPWSPGLGD